jgi:hypothetical protein
LALSRRRLPSLLRDPGGGVPKTLCVLWGARARFPRSQQYYEGATTSHPRICGHLWVRFRSPPDPSCFVFARSAPARSKVPSRPGLCAYRPPESPASLVWTQMGSLRSPAILPVPVLRSSTPVEPTCPRHVGRIDAAPALRTTKASATAFRGSLTQLRHPLSYASHFVLPLTRKARFRLAGSPLPGGRPVTRVLRARRLPLIETRITSIIWLHNVRAPAPVFVGFSRLRNPAGPPAARRRFCPRTTGCFRRTPFPPRGCDRAHRSWLLSTAS